MAKYINPYTDFGFKKLFGEEASKGQLKDFLNELLPEAHKIKDLFFKQTEQLPETIIERKAIFDIFCEAESGAKFIVEMQKAKLDFFKDRAVFYTTFPIKAQAEMGDWNFELKPIYCIAILDFKFNKDTEKEKSPRSYLSNVQLKDQYCKVFYDKLTYIFIEMPRFTKKENEVITHFEKWLYFLKNLESFDSIPEILQEEIFIECFKKAEIANYDQKERERYEESLKIYRDLKGVIDTSFNDGVKAGIEKGEKIGVVKGRKITIQVIKLHNEGKSVSEISTLLGISEKEVQEILNEL